MGWVEIQVAVGYGIYLLGRATNRPIVQDLGLMLMAPVFVWAFFWARQVITRVRHRYC